VEAAGAAVIVVDTNVVARFVLRGEGPNLAEGILEQDASWVAPPLIHSELRVDTGSVLELAKRSGCTSYDCEFVSVALDLGVRLVTSDRQVLTAFPETAVSPEAFVAH
jgi:hypothetical protein